MRFGNRTAMLAAAVAMLTVVAMRARAQGNRVDLERITLEQVQTPIYQPNTDHEATSRYDWVQITVEYEAEGAADGWIDQVQLDWYVYLEIPGRDILMRERTRYHDVKEGDCRAAVYIRPRFIQRYAHDGRFDEDDVRVLVVASANGELSDRHLHPERRPRSRWWTGEQDDVLVRDDELHNRSETPFAPLHWDYYQYLAPEE